MLDILSAAKDTFIVVADHDYATPDDEWMTPPQVARVIPNTTAQAVRRWAEEGQLPGAFRTPSGRWHIPWSAVVGIMGFDPRESASPSDRHQS